MSPKAAAHARQKSHDRKRKAPGQPIGQGALQHLGDDIDRSGGKSEAERSHGNRGQGVGERIPPAPQTPQGNRHCDATGPEEGEAAKRGGHQPLGITGQEEGRGHGGEETHGPYSGQSDPLSPRDPAAGGAEKPGKRQPPTQPDDPRGGLRRNDRRHPAEMEPRPAGDPKQGSQAPPRSGTNPKG
jgi:hypothetical protein